MNRTTFFVLVLFAIFAFLLRWYLMPTHLFFGPEQGRDFLAIRDIVHEQNVTLIGPKTDLSGVFHGPLYYYIAAIPFALSGGNPLFVAAALTLVQSLTVFLAYALGKEVSGKREVGLISAFLYTVSYGAIVYSRWLTQVPLAIPLSFLMLWQLFRFLHGEKRALLWVAISAGLLGQVQFIYFIYLPIFFLYLVIRFRKQFFQTPISIKIWSIVLFILVGWGTYILFDLRHEFLILKSVFAAFKTDQHTAFSFDPITLFIRWVLKFI